MPFSNLYKEEYFHVCLCCITNEVLPLRVILCADLLRFYDASSDAHYFSLI